jgi:hypothetical protein
LFWKMNVNKKWSDFLVFWFHWFLWGAIYWMLKYP